MLPPPVPPSRPSETLRGASSDQGDEFFFTHVFSSYNPKPGSAVEREIAAVRKSWKVAAERAQAKGIRVHYLDAVLDQDADSAPAFAQVKRLENYMIDAYGRTLPTVGEVFKVAQQHGKGKWVLYTNADIGMFPEFYIRAKELVLTDHSAPHEQRRVYQSTLEYLIYCLKDAKSKSKPSLCAQDARSFYFNEGGVPSHYPQVKRELARAAVEHLAAAKLVGSKVSSRMKAYVDAGGDAATAASDISSPSTFDGYIPIESKVEMAFTITRLDLVMPALSSDDVLDAVYNEKWSEANSHPGNDCFLMRRSTIPDDLVKLAHPIGWPPWGFWVPRAFPEQTATSQRGFRRVIGTETNRYTFHIGEFGVTTSKNWNPQIDPGFFLFLTANVYANFHGERGWGAKAISPPPHCSSVKMWRATTYCSKAPHPKYCRGNTRLACSWYFSPSARELKFVQSQCTSWKEKRLPVPQCALCAHFQNNKKAMCEDAPMTQECEHAGCTFDDFI